MTPQVFQTNNSNRWKSLKWTGRVFIFVLSFFLIVLVFALIRGSKPDVPNLEAKSRAFENTLDPSHSLFLRQKSNLKYKGFKDFLIKKEKQEIDDSIRKASRAFLKDTVSPVDIPYIRAAFYTPWTKSTSLPALQEYGNNLNTVFPEYFFIDTANNFHLQTRIDSAGLAEMRKKGIRILPMLNNFNSNAKVNDFQGALSHTILTDTVKRKLFIKQVLDTLLYYKFQGINVDFENLTEPSNEPLTSFQRDLYNALHAKGLTVTMDMSIKNEDFDYKKLALYNDYVILMAYDQYNEGTGPGPISGSKWIEDQLDWLSKLISPDKIILGIAAYGQDWATDAEGKTTASPITYSGAINTAKIANSKVYFDNTSYNLHFNYTVQLGVGKNRELIKHEVWFTDAASSFNIMRFSDEYATAGTAVWRLGGEDTRLWTFYAKDLSNDSLDINGFDFSSLYKVPIIPNSVGYIDSSGEVLDIIARPNAGKINLEIDTTEMLIAEQNYVQLPSGYLINKFGEDTTVGKGHKIILTFDDGPDPNYTPRILDILEKEKVPATFFVVGLQAEKNIPVFQRIISDGFEIGNHTFTHNNIAKMSVQRSDMEMKLTRLLIESI